MKKWENHQSLQRNRPLISSKYHGNPPNSLEQSGWHWTTLLEWLIIWRGEGPLSIPPIHNTLADTTSTLWTACWIMWCLKVPKDRLNTKWTNSKTHCLKETCSLWVWKRTRKLPPLVILPLWVQCHLQWTQFLSSTQIANSSHSSEPHKTTSFINYAQTGKAEPQRWRLSLWDTSTVRTEENGAADAPQTGKWAENQKKRKRFHTHLWTMHWKLHVWAANDMHRLGGGGEVFLQHNLPHLTA